MTAADFLTKRLYQKAINVKRQWKKEQTLSCQNIPETQKEDLERSLSEDEFLFRRTEHSAEVLSGI